MKRVAVLIEASNLCGGRIPGAARDVEILQDFLLSDIGGAWEKDEIIILRNPHYFALSTTLGSLKGFDYAFVSYSGHGFHSKELDETKVCARLTAEKSECCYPVSKLVPSCDKFTLSIDCCRNVEHDPLFESVQSKMASSESLRMSVPRYYYRELYDDSINKAEKGGIIMYSCNLGESAGESSQGGYFTRGLVETVPSRESVFENKVWGVDAAFDAATLYVKNKNRTQNPQFEPGRRRNYFPWAVFPKIIF